MPPLATFGIQSSLNSPVSASASAEKQRAAIAKLEKATRSELAIRTLRAEEKATELATRVGVLEVHARMAAREIGQLKAAQNAKTGRKKKANHFGSDRRLLTGEEGMREARLAEEAREAAKQAEEAKRTAHKETIEQQQADRIRLAPTREHSGSIHSFKKSELLDVLASLALVANPSDAARLRDEKGTNAQLVERIETYLADHRSILATAPQFKGLYPGSRGTKRRLNAADPTEQENIAMPSTSTSEPATN